jgi:hypothetical protein
MKEVQDGDWRTEKISRRQRCWKDSTRWFRKEERQDMSCGKCGKKTKKKKAAKKKKKK